MQKKKEDCSKRSNKQAPKAEPKRKQAPKAKSKAKTEIKTPKSRAATRVPAPNKRRHSLGDYVPKPGGIIRKSYSYAVATLIMAIGAVLFMMLFTFTVADLVTGAPQVLNIFGIAGAHIANIMLMLFGLSSFFFSLICLLMGLITLCGRPFEVRAKEMLGLCLLIFGSSPLFALTFEGRLILDHLPGGVLGAWIAKISIAYMSFTTVYASTLVLIFVGLLLVTDTSFYAFVKHVFNLFKTIILWTIRAFSAPFKYDKKSQELMPVAVYTDQQHEDYDDPDKYYEETPSEILSDSPHAQPPPEFQAPPMIKEAPPEVKHITPEASRKIDENQHLLRDEQELEDIDDPDDLANIDFAAPDIDINDQNAHPRHGQSPENEDAIAAILERIKGKPKLRKSVGFKSVPALEPNFEYNSIISPEKLDKGNYDVTQASSVLGNWQPRRISKKQRVNEPEPETKQAPVKVDAAPENQWLEPAQATMMALGLSPENPQNNDIQPKRPICLTEDILAQCDESYHASVAAYSESIQGIALNPDAITKEANLAPNVSKPLPTEDKEDALAKLARQHGLKLPENLLSAQSPADVKQNAKATAFAPPASTSQKTKTQDIEAFHLNTAPSNAVKTRALLESQALTPSIASFDNFDIRPAQHSPAAPNVTATVQAPPKEAMPKVDQTSTRVPIPVREASSFVNNKKNVATSDDKEAADSKSSSETNPAIKPAQFLKQGSFVVAEGKHKASEDELNEAEKALIEKLGQVRTYQHPPLSLLKYKPDTQKGYQPEELQELADKIEEKLAEYKVEGQVVQICPGPIITRFEFQPAPGTKVSRIAGLSDDLMMALEITSIRILAPIPGKGVVGIEIPNQSRNIIYLKEVIASKSFIEAKSVLTMALGQDSEGEPVVSDLAKMPHLLVAGSTGSGKSVGINTMLCSLLYNATPDELRLILVDPKCLELSIYKGIPHLLVPPITTAKEAASALDWACDEMDRRYQLLSELGVRNILGYNERIKNPPDQRALRHLDKRDSNGEKIHKNLPYIVIVVDEFADLMMVSGKEIETSIARLAQKARAAGIHIILATQRPSTNVITGVIKANFPTRLAFRVFSVIDSRTILDSKGAEALLGMGDSLFLPPNSGLLQRVHGAYVSDEEVQAVADFLSEQGEVQYDESILQSKEDLEGADFNDGDDKIDALYDQAVSIVANAGQASASYLQRRMSIGFNRAARIIDQMEREGVVGPANGQKPREVLIDPL